MAVNDRDKALYFKRSFVTADGLWFMKVEDRRGFDEALEVDCEVWKVMPKIQARTLKSIIGKVQGIEALHECLTAKLELEGYSFESRMDGGENSFIITIGKCPWHEALVRAGRTSVAGKVGKRICTEEYEVWAREFGDNIVFEKLDYLCAGSTTCVLKYHVAEKRAESPEDRQK
jgi:hypothetical protein